MEKKDKSKRIYLNVPYDEKDEAKKLGARWDPGCEKWYIPSTVRVDVSMNARKMLEIWGEEETGVDEECEVMVNETQTVLQKINHILDVTSSKNEGVDLIL